MSLPYQRELDFMTLILERMRLTVHLLHPDDTRTVLDAGLRGILGMQADYDTDRRAALQWPHPRTIYKVLDPFMCNYVYFLLPASPEPTAVVVGPYLTFDPTPELLLEQAERLGTGLNRLSQQADFYASLPVFHDPTIITAVITCFGEKAWGSASAFDVADVNYEQYSPLPAAHAPDAPIEQENILQQMQQLEERYAYENELMDIVAKGLTHRAEVMMSSVSMLNYQSRTPDPLRNMKNYCIICNTILRKAAEKGGVHPLHLDRASGNFARKIETTPTLEQSRALIGEMIRSYCRLVHTQANHHYSAVVQKALTYIDANLSGDLSLSILSGLLQVTPSYLSALFHRETGQTLARHIVQKRMRAARQLLVSTRLQIQTVAQLTGFTDPNYFSKLFRQHFGMTPGQYRQEQRSSLEFQD